MGIGKRIRMAIEARQLTLKEAAKQCDISYSSLQNWLGDLREPRPEALINIGAHLGVSIDWLLTGEGRMLREIAPVTRSIEQLIDAQEVEMLRLFRSLEESDQREVQRVIEDRKRMRDMEHRLATLTAAITNFQRA